MEFNVEVYCPHCDSENYSCVDFDEGCADISGVDSSPTRATCDKCCKDFWFDARLNFEAESMDTWKMKPKQKGGWGE